MDLIASRSFSHDSVLLLGQLKITTVEALARQSVAKLVTQIEQLTSAQIDNILKNMEQHPGRNQIKQAMPHDNILFAREVISHARKLEKSFLQVLASPKTPTSM